MKYCEDCKYFDGIGFNWCNFYEIREFMPQKDTFIYRKKKLQKVFKGVEKNKDGNCKYYKRKWWKFWLKGDK
jgi:hypothetical protein